MKLCVVTGASSGIGRVTAEELAKRGYHVLLANRSAEKTRPVLDAIHAAGGKAEMVPLDLGDFASVRACAKTVLDRGEPLPLLVANAGLAAPGLSKDGFELTFATNHLGHYLLTRLLLPALEASPEGARVVVVSSRAHYRAKAIDWAALTKPSASLTALPEYGVSKLANILFAKELARRVPAKIHTYALHPGVVATDGWRRVPWGLRHLVKLFMLSNEDGAKTTLHCATSDAVKDQTGLYYDACKEKRPSRLAEDEAVAAELWTKSAEWTGLAA